MRFRKTFVALTAALVAVGMFAAPLSTARVDAGVISYVKLNEFSADADSGIDPANTYTHLLDFGNGTPGATVNGVAFTQVNGANLDAIPGFNFSVNTSGRTSHGGNGNTGVDAGQRINAVLTDMVYNGGNAAGGVATITLSGLAPGVEYDTRIYSRQWGAGAPRTVTFDFDTDGLPDAENNIPTINEDDASLTPPSDGTYADNTAYALSYKFVAQSDAMSISITQHNFNHSWHVYGLTNQEFGVNELLWTGTGPGDWKSANWTGTGDAFPDVHTNTTVQNHVVTVTAGDPAKARSLTVDSGGLSIATGGSLQVFRDASFALGTSLELADGGSFSAGSGNVVTLEFAGTAGSPSTISGSLSVGTLTDGGAAGFFRKAGDGTLTAETVTAQAGTAFQVSGGTFAVGGANPLGSSTQAIELDGGTIEITGPLAMVSGVPIDPAGLTATASSNWVDRLTADAISGVGMSGAYPDEVHNTNAGDMWLADNEVDTAWYKVDLGGSYDTVTLRQWNYFEAAAGNGSRGVNEADIYYYAGADDPGTDFSVNWTLFEAWHVFTQELGGTFDVTEEIAMDVTARWIGIDIDSNHSGDNYVGFAELRFTGDGLTIGAISMTGTDVNVTNDSELAVVGPSGAFGAATLKNGILTTSGAPVSFTGGTSIVTVEPAGGRVGVNPLSTTDYGGPITGGHAGLTFAFAGPGTKNVVAAADYAAGTVAFAAGSMTGATLEAAAGRTEIVGTAPWAGSTEALLSGGTLALTPIKNVAIEPGPAGAIAHYSFDDVAGDIVPDSSGSAVTYDAMNYGATVVAGLVGSGAMSFDGTDDYIGLGADTNPLNGESAFSVAWWSNMDTHQVGAQISSDSSAGANRLILQDNPPNAPVYANGDVFGGDLQYTADSQWHHYALTVDNTNGGAWRFYVDGAEEGFSTHTFTMSAFELQMGKHVDVYFEGMIDEVYAYNRALTAAQIAEMAGIEVVDMSSYNVTVTEPSTLDAAHTPWLDLGTLTMRDGAVLQTTGAPISFTGTELAADAAAVGFDPQTSTDYGTITNSSAMAEVVVSKTGSSTWELDAPFAGTTDNIKWKVEEGTLAVGGDDTLGGRPVTIAGGVLDTLGTASIGSSPVEMTGGTLSVHLPPLKNLSSGFDETSGTTVADGDPDPIYTLTVSPQDLPEDLPKPATVISPHPAWLANNTASKWIGPAHPGTTRIAVGDYEFEATFDLSGLDLETVAVALNLASDNLITDVLLNGTSTGITQAGFAGLSPTQFLDTGLIDGLNTLTFKLTNDAPVDAGGLRVQAGVYQSEQILDLGATAITVNGGGTLDLHGPWAAQVGPVVLKAGTLTTAGTIAETIFGGTTLDVEAVDVGLNTQVVTNPGALDGTALVAPATLAKTGLSDLVMDQPGVNLGQLTIDVQQGRLIVTGGTAPVDDAVLQLGGGELVLAADSSDGSLAFDKAVAVTAPSSLTAGPGHTATTNVAVTLGSAAAGVTLGDGATLTLGSTDDYSLDVAGDVNGAAGGLSVSQGDVTLSGGTNVLSLDVTGGTLNANAVVSAGNLTATGGMLNTAAAAVTTDSLTVAGTAAVSAAGTGIAVNDGGTAKIGPTTFQTTGGTMSFAGSVLATGTDTLILGGGDVTVTAPGFGEVTPGLSYHLITNDADSGIDPVNKTYTHAIDFGSAGTAIVNGLTFANDFAGNGSEDVPNRHGGNLATAVTGEIAKVFQDMDYNAFPAQIILAGLTEGEVYDLRLYNRSWGANGTRTQIFKYDIDNDGSFEGDPLTLNTDVPTDNPPGFDGAAWNVGYAQSYTYTAGPGGEIRVEITPTVTNNSYHLYGLTNEIATGSLVTLPADVTLQNLIGIGTINAAAVDVLHTIAPGNDGIGKITVGVAELGMDPGVTYNAEISLADVTAVVADQIEVIEGGLLELGGTLAVSTLDDRADSSSWSNPKLKVVHNAFGEIGDTLFADVTAGGEPVVEGVVTHIGQGAFLREVTYTEAPVAEPFITDVELDVFVALGGDADGDEKVWLSDWAALRANFGNTGTGKTWTEGNFDPWVDDKVWLSDWAALRANFGNASYVPAGAAAVPEPGTIVMLLAGLLCVASVWRRRRG